MVDVLITRVPEHHHSHLLEEAVLRHTFSVDHLHILPHDEAIAGQERLLARGNSDVPMDKSCPLYDADLFRATLRWIGKTFVGKEDQANAIQDRMTRLQRAWRWLTEPQDRWEKYDTNRGWKTSQLGEGIIFKKKDGALRRADIVAYDRAATEPDAQPLLIVEYVTGEDRGRVAKWWAEVSRARAIAIRN